MRTEKTPPKDTHSGWGRTALVVAGVLGAVAVNIAAFMLSAAAITAVAEAAGISRTIAWALVLAVDGLMVTGTVVFIANKLRGRSVAYPLTVLASGVLLSIVCNALHAKAGGGHIVKLGSEAKMAVSAIPAVSLALSFHLIADMVKDSLGVGQVSTETVGMPSTEASTEASAPVSASSPAERPRQVSTDTRPDTPRTPAVERPRTPKPAPRRTPAEAPKRTAADTRAEARKLLQRNPDMNAGDLARALGRKPAGSIRTMRTELLEELRDAGELPSVRAIAN